ncbi:MAG TPA: flagellar motor switch phosphatase FliY [Clostridia bacterium]|nr:flagellar motor switch phosphatase FliY [Clostridia bacterium]
MNNMLSQEEIDALLGGTVESTDSGDNSVKLTDEEKDTIGEVGNISMGTAATTLSALLGQRVTITTPEVEVLTLSELAKQYPIPFVAVDVRYKEGLEGVNLLILKVEDVSIITDLMMSGDGKTESNELTDLHLSAISEAMNQMVGSSSTSLSEMLNKKIDINPPDAFMMDLTTDNLMQYFENYTDYEDVFVKIAFKMTIGDLIDSKIMQLMPVEFAKVVVKGLLHGISGIDVDVDTGSDTNSVENHVDITPRQPQQANFDDVADVENTYFAETDDKKTETARIDPARKVSIRPAQFQSFDEPSTKSEMPENIAIIQDVPLKITVELGKTVKKISEILEFGPGTIIELDKLVGEPLNILVNGQYVARGEVVVIDENYGIRITEIVNQVSHLPKS